MIVSAKIVDVDVFLAAARRRRGLVQLRAHPPRFGRGRADRETLDGRRGRQRDMLTLAIQHIVETSPGANSPAR